MAGASLMVLAWLLVQAIASTAVGDPLLYNITVDNHGDMDADIQSCHCGRGTGMCRDLGVILKGKVQTFGGIAWSQFVYPDGSVCYDYLVLTTGSNNPPEPFFPFKACTLNNTLMGEIWADVALRGHMPRLVLAGNSSVYNCSLY